MPQDRELQLGVLISGGGSTLANLVERISDGRLRGVRIRLVIASRGAVGGVEVARKARLPLTIIRKKDYPDEAAFSGAIGSALDQAAVELVVMAGFLCFWCVPPRYLGRVLNIHPALLPEFGGRGMYGLQVHAAVLRAGRKQSGCTVHLVNNEYDGGPIVAQRRVLVLPSDSPERLAARVAEQERELYPEVIQQIADHGVEWLRGFVRPRNKTGGAL